MRFSLILALLAACEPEGEIAESVRWGIVEVPCGEPIPDPGALLYMGRAIRPDGIVVEAQVEIVGDDLYVSCSDGTAQLRWIAP